MKNMLNMLFLSLFISQTICALDLHTDQALQGLKTAIRLAEPLEKVLDAWNNVIKGNIVSMEDKEQFTSQLVAYAQEQKKTLEQELKNLGNATYLWATAQAVFGSWCVMSLGRLLYSIKKQHPVSINKINWALFPISSLVLYNHYNKDIIGISALFGLFITVTAPPYCFYKAYCNLSDALHYKNSIEEKIKNLTAFIEFMQQSSNQS